MTEETQEERDKKREKTLESAHKMMEEADGFILVTVLPEGATHSAFALKGLDSNQTFHLAHAMALENYRFFATLAGPVKNNNPVDGPIASD